MTRLSLTDLAIRERLGYHQTREKALRGELGVVIREGGRLFVMVADNTESGSGADK